MIGVHLKHLSRSPTTYPPQGAGLSPQSLPYSRVVSEFRAQHLYRNDFTIGSERSKHDSHTTGTNLFGYSVVANEGATYEIRIDAAHTSKGNGFLSRQRQPTIVGIFSGGLLTPQRTAATSSSSSSVPL